MGPVESPPLVGGTGRFGPKRIRILDHGEFESRGVAVAKKHDDETFAFVIVPDASSSCPTPVRMPDPIALNYFVRRTLPDLGSFDGLTVVGGAACGEVARDSFHAEAVYRPFHQITIAVFQVTILGTDKLRAIALV